MAHLKIDAEGAIGRIHVDGVQLKCVTDAVITLGAGTFPTLEVRMVATESSMEIKDGILKVGALEAPEALERALLAHLKGKYAKPA